MNKTTVATTVVIFAGLTAIEIANKTRKQRKQHEALLKFQKSIRALATANEIMFTMYENGELKNKSYDEILNDYEFFKLVNNPTL